MRRENNACARFPALCGSAPGPAMSPFASAGFAPGGFASESFASGSFASERFASFPLTGGSAALPRTSHVDESTAHACTPSHL